jgi:lipopolysaccharide export LptBFGC system permease protein LptF
VFLRIASRNGRTIAAAADRGTFLATDDLDVILFRLTNGRLVNNQPDYRTPRVLSFRQHDLPINMPQVENFRGRGDGTKELTITELYQLGGDPALPQARRNAIRANFHFRMVEVAMMLLVPLLAVALAVPPKRSTSGLGIFIAIIFVVVYHKVNQYAEQMGALGRFEPVIALWAPFLVFGGRSSGCTTRSRTSLAASRSARSSASSPRSPLSAADRRRGRPAIAASINLQFFPSRRIAFYMTRLFLVRSAAVLVAWSAS